jgi:hypothetical protein
MNLSRKARGFPLIINRRTPGMIAVEHEKAVDVDQALVRDLTFARTLA